MGILKNPYGKTMTKLERAIEFKKNQLAVIANPTINTMAGLSNENGNQNCFMNHSRKCILVFVEIAACLFVGPMGA